MSFLICYVLFLFHISTGAMALSYSQVPSVQQYFPDLKGDLTKLSWAHAVNSQDKLREALKDSKVMMLEADVIYGRITGSDTRQPVMGHPPAEESDLSLRQFIDSVINVQASDKKGIKLDFKSTRAFNESCPIIEDLNDKLTFPIWLNADILRGPVNSTGSPVDADSFLSLSQKILPKTTLSLGWTTKYEPFGGYTQEELNAMKNAIKRNRINQPVTLAVRAALVACNQTGIQNLINDIDSYQQSNTTSLTVWMSSDSDRVNVSELRNLILYVRKSRVFLDVPESLRRELNLDAHSGKTPVSAAQGVIVALLTSVTALFSNILKLFD